LTPPNDGTQKGNKLDLRLALKKGAGQDPNGNACGGACSEEDQARIDETEPLPLYDETAGSIDAEIKHLQNEIAGIPANQAPTTGCNSVRDCGATPGQSPITQADLLMLELNALVGLQSVVPADTTEAGLMGIGLGMGRVGMVRPGLSSLGKTVSGLQDRAVNTGRNILEKPGGKKAAREIF
ncbi:hypothetical protein KZZ07_20485, partial [Mameliella sp. CS4]|uniref:hypothetical protein n=1 Tax=Mameliella sp. CS4 TaxID=2862329 RepID=UPI001C5F77F5